MKNGLATTHQIHFAVVLAHQHGAITAVDHNVECASNAGTKHHRMSDNSQATQVTVILGMYVTAKKQ